MKQNTIIFKSYYLTKGLLYIFATGVLVTVIIFLETDISVGLKLQTSITLISLGVIVLLYFNKLEPHYIRFNDEELTISYINKFIFKYRSKKYFKSEIRVSINKHVIELYSKSGKQVIIRKNATEAEDWITLMQYFSSNNPQY